MSLMDIESKQEWCDRFLYLLSNQKSLSFDIETQGVCTHKEGINGNSAIPIDRKERNSMSAFVGQSFTTGNSTVSGLPIGTQIKVVGSGQLQVTFVPAPPKPVFAEGDRINTKYGKGTVVRMTTTKNLNAGVPPKDTVLYIADGTTVVRIASIFEVSKASW